MRERIIRSYLDAGRTPTDAEVFAWEVDMAPKDEAQRAATLAYIAWALRQ